MRERTQIRICLLGRKGVFNKKTQQKSLWSDGNFLYPKWAGCHTDTYMCQNSLNYVLRYSHFTVSSYIAIKWFLKEKGRDTQLLTDFLIKGSKFQETLKFGNFDNGPSEHPFISGGTFRPQ